MKKTLLMVPVIIWFILAAGIAGNIDLGVDIPVWGIIVESILTVYMILLAYANRDML